MSSLAPRAVVVRRPSEYDELLAARGTRGAAEFFLRERGRTIAEVEERHRRLQEARTDVLGAVPADWRRAELLRADVPRFLFEREDVVVCVGQDGLVANVARYAAGLPVIGVNPDPGTYEGVLVRHPPSAVRDLLRAAAGDTSEVEPRTMVECVVDDGRRLLALNEIFLGHRSHQSARYRISAAGREERQSSSGVLVVTGTGATGWGRSVRLAHRSELALPRPDEPSLAFFVREAWPSVSTGATLVEGRVESLALVSELDEGGVAFGDGIESDRLELAWGQQALVRVATEHLRLLV